MKHPIKFILTVGLVLFFPVNNLMAQQSTQTGSIEGTILDRDSEVPLAGVNIQVKGTTLGAASDESGKYVIKNLEPGTYILVFTFIGFTEKTENNVIVQAGEATKLNIALDEELLSLSEIVVTPGSFSIMGDMPVSRQTLSSEDIKNISFSEDITRAVSRLPGVSSNDFSSKFTVRGGEDDEVLMILDGMELYDPFHQRDFAGGLFSIVDVEAISGVDLLTGGFSAEYGDRQSAVFNMQTKQIQDNQRHTSIGLSIMAARLYTDGTFADNKGSYLFTGRQGLLDQAFKLIDETERTPRFYDLMGKVQYKLTDKQHLSFYVLHAGDETKIRDVSPEAFDRHDTSYKNSYAWLTLKSFYNPKLYSRTLLSTGLITHDRNGAMQKYEFTDKLTFSVKDKRTYSFFGVKQDWNWEASNRFFLKGGFDIRQLEADYDYSYSIEEKRLDLDYNLFDYQNGFDFQSKPSGQQGSAYFSSRFMAFQNLFLETGLRYDFAIHTKDKLWSPRVSAAYSFSKNTFLRAAWGHYYQTQFMNNLDINHNVTEFDKAELSEHYVLGLEHLFANGISLRLDGYYKDISRLSPTYENLRDLWELFPESRNDEVRLDISGAEAKGIELFLKYDTGKEISWWFSYALANAEENITNIESNALLIKQTGSLPRANNQLHTIYGDINYRPNKKWYFNLSWQYNSGWPLTKYTFIADTLNNDDLHFSPAHNEFRGTKRPDFHRMDIRINRNFEIGLGKISTYLHVINIYNRKNMRKWDLDVVNAKEELVPDDKGGYKLFEGGGYFFGTTPVIGVSWEF
ncbi:MAG: TonB-dependent receptor [Calditrichaeota bacterium]|nr:MAG: TonB-dependent receptor [Calditrichota bacterium]MBL1205830.1 TonB-dependent receptor [Calditrichota bacterium]NOG45657.1 TonB-dependent receptor [Calditrichota bacterium]